MYNCKVQHASPVRSPEIEKLVPVPTAYPVLSGRPVRLFRAGSTSIVAGMIVLLLSFCAYYYAAPHTNYVRICVHSQSKKTIILKITSTFIPLIS
jgi:hypothetical protein